MSSDRVNLLGLPRAQLETFVATRLGAKPFRARQLMKWIYRRGAADFSTMSDLAQEFRAQLAEIAEITVPQIVTEQVSKDGTRKWVLSGAFSRNTSKQALKALAAAERLDAAALAARWAADRPRSAHAV